MTFRQWFLAGIAMYCAPVPALEVTYECVVNGQRVIQKEYCPPEESNPTSESAMPVKPEKVLPLSDVLAAGGAAREGLANQGLRDYYRLRQVRGDLRREASENWAAASRVRMDALQQRIESYNRDYRNRYAYPVRR